MKNMRIMLIVMVMAFTSITFQFLSQGVSVAHAFSDQTIQRGATGSDVIELQARLQYNGYYHGPIDGVYGWSTYWAVKNFQNMFGLEEVDGLVGQKPRICYKDQLNFIVIGFTNKLTKEEDLHIMAEFR